MATTNFKGNPVKTSGELPAVGSKAPDFTLVKGDLSEVTLKDFAGKKLVLNIFPSIDTGVCAMSVRQFNKWVSEKENTVVLCVSKVITASDFRYNTFATDYGVLQADGPLKGLCARAVVAVDENGVVTYTELVPEITQEPSYNLPL